MEVAVSAPNVQGRLGDVEQISHDQMWENLKNSINEEIDRENPPFQGLNLADLTENPKTITIKNKSDETQLTIQQQQDNISIKSHKDIDIKLLVATIKKTIEATSSSENKEFTIMVSPTNIDKLKELIDEAKQQGLTPQLKIRKGKENDEGYQDTLQQLQEHLNSPTPKLEAPKDADPKDAVPEPPETPRSRRSPKAP